MLIRVRYNCPECTKVGQSWMNRHSEDERSPYNNWNVWTDYACKHPDHNKDFEDK